MCKMVSEDSNTFCNNYRHKDRDPVPYLILMDSSNHTGNIGNVHPMSLEQRLVASKISGITELKKIGRNKVKCVFEKIKY
jgi:hypothetical protein